MNLQIKTFTCDFLSLLFPRNNLTFFLLSLVAPETAGVWEKSHFSFAFLSSPFQHDYDEEKKTAPGLKIDRKKYEKAVTMCWLKSLLLCTHAEAREESQRMTRITYEHIFHEIKKNLSGDHCVGRKFLSPKKHRQRRGPFFSGLFSLSHQKRLSELKELVTAENGRKNRLKQRHKFSSWCTREKSKRENFIFSRNKHHEQLLQGHAFHSAFSYISPDRT